MKAKSKKYAGEGMIVHEAGHTILTRPLSRVKYMFLRLIGIRSKDSTMFNRDFYAAITSDQNYVILGESRYGIAKRTASLKKDTPRPPRRKNS